MTLTNIDHEKQIYCFKVFYAFLVVLLLRMNNPCIGCSEREMQALLAFKQGLVDDDNSLLSWGREVQNKDCCQWDGVYCSNHTGHVVKLDLGDQSLQGTISPKLVELQDLEYLNLSLNNFRGSQIPDFIGSFSNLRYLNLSNAKFGGEIPYQLENLTRLEYLDLSFNGYSVIHAKNLNWLPNLSGLKHLDLSGTNLSDVVGWMEAVNMLPKLRDLILQECNLPPPIMSSVSVMNSSKSLVRVDLSFNNLNSSIFQLLSSTHTNLVHLDLSENNFAGVIGWLEAVNMLPKLRDLILSGCNLPPPTMSSVSVMNSSKSLVSVDLSRNNLNSSIFQWLSGTHTNLVELDLSWNNFTGAVGWLEAVNMLPKLRDLILQGCNLPPPTMSSVSVMNSSKSLVSVDLSRNNLNSSIFQWLSSTHTNLVELDLSWNNFAGVIGWLEAVNMLPKLRDLILSGCNLPLPIISSVSVMNSSKSLVSVDLSSNNLDSSIFQWLSGTHTNLVYLDLSGNNLIGAVGWLEAVNMLPKLRDLILSWCNLPPPIISSVSVKNSSKSLVRVYLSYNNLNSSIFQWLSGTHTNLVELDLSWNNLNGSSIPDDFGNMSSLAYLALSGSRLKGGIPSSFAKLCRLRELRLRNNSLSGQLSDIIDILSKCAQNTLEYLDISDNHGIMGSVPENIGQMSKLESIWLEGNSLEGVISEIHFSKLFKLKHLGLSSNALVLNFSFDWVPPFQLGEISLRSCKMGPSFPKWLQTQKSVSFLDISDNGITDTIPSWLWDMSLFSMDLSQNQIRGTIGNLRSEFPPKLNVSWNQLEGPIPSTLSKVLLLDLSNNNFSVAAASFLSTTEDSSLTFLDISSNHIFGELPDCWIHLKQLVFLDLSNNSLSGKIPTTMGYLFSIETLRLNNNGFVGELPSQLKNCRSLTLFNLAENKLSGSIPEWLGASLPNLTILILQSNNFYGSIPPQLCHLTRIQLLDLSMNNISGTIPKCLKSLTTLTQKGSSSQAIQHSFFGQYLRGGFFERYDDEAFLTWKGFSAKFKSTLGLLKSIDLSSNKLIGEIPSEITYLVGLISLNLSRNQLTGQIPSRIGNLQELESLDLSRNQINGRIPTSLSRIASLGKLDLSENNLFGKIPIGTQLQSFDDAYGGNPLLCGAPLPRTCPEEEKGPGRMCW
ncbi:putative LRR receptor-like serine/threonine-protein kinase [Prunus yedoensis var. nudiflora]|uniref:Putative LRR receptor-like serine/threonine-protein kinase n=1 Tax=Prunus yedoensis var. nudiflora TaxID=2094558 RepID=A0A314XXE6_PRUYE|nr:putative LRR receptor-like serine/threonine-protein kinase [Prunus yedoensis var. nudiflora]